MMVEQLAEKWVDKWAALTVDKMVVPMGETRAVMKVVGMALQMAEPTVDEMAAPTVAMMADALVCRWVAPKGVTLVGKWGCTLVSPSELQ